MLFHKSLLIVLFILLFSFLSFPKVSDNNIIVNASNNDYSISASETNVESMILNDGSSATQNTHGSYQNNTNACASCHQTHTGISKSLLFRDGVYNTCIACHDGTLGFYNIFDQSTAGTFGGTDSGNMSIHTANGTLKHKAAPGGNVSANSDGWLNEFNCASCHSPHGSYSDRLLHYNPNGMGRVVKAQGGIGAVNVPIVNFSKLSAYTNYIKYPIFPVRGTASDFGYDISDGLPSNAVVIKLYEYVPTASDIFKPLNDPWLSGYSYRTPNKDYWTRFYKTLTPDYTIEEEANGTLHYSNIIDEDDESWNSNLNFDWHKGYVYEVPWDVDKNTMTPNSTTLNEIAAGDIARAYVVRLDLIPIFDPAKDNGDGVYQPGEEKTYGDIIITTSNQRALFAGETHPSSINIEDRWGILPGSRVSGWGVAMTNFCASCHTDYLTSNSTETGTWSKAYRHSTYWDIVTCVRCHYAHGTDISVMRDAKYRTRDEIAMELFNGDIAKANNYLLDQNPSSALKRYTNMSVCWGCHTESISTQLVNTTVKSSGLSPNEGKANWPPQ